MKKHIIISFLIILTAYSCNNNNGEQKSGSPIEQDPAKVVTAFLKWYKINMDTIGTIRLVNNNGNDPYDSTKFYSVNFDGTEKYLSELKKSGYISDKYVAQWRRYFKQYDDNFKANPQNEGPPDNFDGDFIMCSQDYDEDLDNIDKAKATNQQIDANNCIVDILFPSTFKLEYKLSNTNGKWEIDDIQNRTWK